MSAYDPSWRYTPEHLTDVTVTWRRFGFRPTTQAEREARQRRRLGGIPVIHAPELRPVSHEVERRLRSIGARA